MVKTENIQENPNKTEPATALSVRRRISIIWIIPVIALLTAGWLGFRTLSTRGPLITVTLQTAEGVEPGKTQVKHKSTSLGNVESVTPSTDLSHVIVKIRMQKVTEPYLTSNAQFWVVRPRLTAEGVSGLSTLVSGSYIEFEPGDKGKSELVKKFKGEEIPPIIPADSPGKTYTLKAGQLGSIAQGSPIYFRGVNVGEVLGSQLSDKDGTSTIQAFIRSPHDKLVYTGTRFWNTSGLRLQADSQGVRVQTSSVQTLLAGGIAFDVPPNSKPGPVADKNSTFTLYENAADAEDAVYTNKLFFLLHFTGSVSGLGVGSEVRMHGLRIGDVTDVHIEYDYANAKVSVPITIEIETDRVKLLNAENTKPNPITSLKTLIAGGLRAQLGSGNLLTGQKIINLETVPNASPAELIIGGQYPEIPTVESADIESIMQSAKTLLDTLQTTVAGLNKKINSPETDQSLHALNRSLANLQKITGDASTQIGPLLQTLQSVANSADSVAHNLDTATSSSNGGGDLAGTMHELKQAARSVRVLADYLENHPEALIQGKKGKAAP